MKVGDIIQDYQFTTDRGIILEVRVQGNEEAGIRRFYYVLAFEQGFASWLPEKYLKKCKVIG